MHRLNLTSIASGFPFCFLWVVWSQKQTKILIKQREINQLICMCYLWNYCFMSCFYSSLALPLNGYNQTHIYRCVWAPAIYLCRLVEIEYYWDCKRLCLHFAVLDQSWFISNKTTFQIPLSAVGDIVLFSNLTSFTQSDSYLVPSLLLWFHPHSLIFR